ncbi:S24/S26 family peptidase [Methanobrevibacter sp.]|uniref:S24/S26 family peptidase n=1 Tax=Methanobrevibacter sp. TaxID=66852 RepID=UPI0026DEF00E|nr:S24/S26 family peptidase [Methanobrevibacter sp.]MDO5860480.1 S24/S26 family peptidase [Methanobrevibacter sp.]
MAKKAVLAIIILVLISIFAINFLYNDSVDIYIGGENVSVTTYTLNFNVDTKSMNNEICDYTLEVMNDTTSNITTLKSGIKDICNDYGLNPEINIDSTIGKDQIPVIVHVDGTSMLPTLQDGQKVLLNKTKDIHVGDIVVAESDEYGGIIKRVGDIQGDEIYLQSDNKNVDYEYINGVLYEVKGVTTWVDISDINGVVIDY